MLRCWPGYLNEPLIVSLQDLGWFWWRSAGWISWLLVESLVGNHHSSLNSAHLTSLAPPTGEGCRLLTEPETCEGATLGRKSPLAPPPKPPETIWDREQGQGLVLGLGQMNHSFCSVLKPGQCPDLRTEDRRIIPVGPASTIPTGPAPAADPASVWMFLK